MISITTGCKGRLTLRTVSRALLELKTDDPNQVFGSPDDLKLLSCMTLFDKTTPRLIQFHTLKNAVNPPFLGGFSIFGTVAAEAEQRSCQRDSLFSMILCNDRKAIVTE